MSGMFLLGHSVETLGQPTVKILWS